MRKTLFCMAVILLLIAVGTMVPALSADIGPDTGVVAITSTPPGAVVRIDGSSVGNTPLTGLELSAGVHTVTASLPGYQQAEEDFSLQAGEDKSISLDLSPVAPTIPFPTTIPVTLPTVITEPTTEPTTLPPTETITITVPTTPIGGGKGWITTHCSVNGAMVTFDNQRAGCSVADGQCTVEVYVSGTPYRTFTVQAQGYQTYTGQVTSWPTDGETVDLYAELSPIPPQSGAISASTSPSGASIYLNGIFQGNSPITIPNLAPIAYTVLAKMDGYTPVSQYVTVNNGQTSYFSASLSPSPQPPRNTGDVYITSNPGGAQVSVDGGYRGVTPITVTLYPGNHNVLLQKSGYNDWINSIYVNANSRQSMSATLVPGSIPGWVTVQASPPTVNVYFDIAYKGQTDSTGRFVIQGVAPGAHTLKLSRAGYNDYTATVTVYSNSEAYVSAVLTPAGGIPTITPVAGYGTISASSVPAGASIYVDNAYMGYTPATLQNVNAGSHTVMLTLDGYQNFVTNVNVASGGTVQVSSSLTPIATPTKAGTELPVSIVGAFILVSVIFVIRRGL